MSDKFITGLKNTFDNEESVTENGAIGFKTTGRSILDCNFLLSSFRNLTEQEICNKFAKAYAEDPLVAIKWAFFARDREEGCGERRTFRILMKWLANTNPKAIVETIKLIPDYGRMDDVWESLLGTSVENDVFEFIASQLKADIENAKAEKPVSLLAKWLPSCNTSSDAAKAKARKIRKALNLNEANYRKTLSKLRKYLDVIEVKVSDKSGEGWANVNYESVPSLANIKYRNSFLKHDEQRRRSFLEKLSKGEAKINAKASGPVDIVHNYSVGRLGAKVDDTLEAMWKEILKKNDGKISNTIVCVDGSGSMNCNIGGTNLSAHDVANGLGIYFADVMKGEYHGKMITFGGNPQFMDISKCKTLKNKLEIVYGNNDCMNTNIMLVFKVLLKNAIDNHVSAEEMPKNILIVSDMEFDNGCYFSDDAAVTTTDYNYWTRQRYNGMKYDAKTKSLFSHISKMYTDAGYKLPKLTFWNVCSRSETIPMKENELGVTLISGFSPNILDMVISEKNDPYEVLLDKLNTERYQKVEEAVKNFV